MVKFSTCMVLGICLGLAGLTGGKASDKLEQDWLFQADNVPTAPVIDRLNIRQDGDSDTVAGKKLNLYNSKK